MRKRETWKMHRALWMLLLMPLCGCSGELVDVTAKVLLDGKPLDGAAVTLVSKGNGGGQDAYGTNADGTVRSFTTSGKGEGVKPGEYRVIVNKSPDTAPQEIPRIDFNDPEALKRFQETTKAGNVAYTRTSLPRIYLDPDRTPLKCKVEPGVGEFVFDLTSTSEK
jgi:hypothetical protein